MPKQEYFTQPTQIEAYRVYDNETPTLIGFLFKHAESDLWHLEYPTRKWHLCGPDKELLIAQMKLKLKG